ncbi:MAG: hypothetical protein ACRDE6_06100 [Candidatus Limnocylindria bacterium]
MTAIDRLFGAACTLSEQDLRKRVAEWRALRDRATSVEDLDGGVGLTLAADEPIVGVADLVARESDCCPFYTFDLRVDGPGRRLEVTAGQGGEPAVRALLGLA